MRVFSQSNFSLWLRFPFFIRLCARSSLIPSSYSSDTWIRIQISVICVCMGMHRYMCVCRLCTCFDEPVHVPLQFLLQLFLSLVLQELPPVLHLLPLLRKFPTIIIHSLTHTNIRTIIIFIQYCSMFSHLLWKKHRFLFSWSHVHELYYIGGTVTCIYIHNKNRLGLLDLRCKF